MAEFTSEWRVDENGECVCVHIYIYIYIYKFFFLAGCTMRLMGSQFFNRELSPAEAVKAQNPNH